MKIKWYGHSCFLLTSESGTRILIDPFDGSIGYKTPSLEADIVLISHDHHDHNYLDNVKGNPKVIKEAGNYEIDEINIHGIKTYHDDKEGENRGKNVIYAFEVDGMWICHLGDLGHTLTKNQVEEIGPVDVLFVPVGGTFTIDSAGAQEVISLIKPKMIIPMHYLTEDVSQPIEPVDVFVERMGGAEEVKACFIEVNPETLPEEEKIFILRYK